MEENTTPKQAKKSLWLKLTSVVGYNQRFFWTTFWFIVGFVIMLVPILVAKRIILAPAILWSLAYLVLGALVGFIFGVPTIITSSVSASSENSGINIEDKKANKKIVQANTNLTQISDWLTKIIVGAGLVQLTKAPAFIVSVANKMAKGLATSQLAADQSYAAVFSGGIIILFLAYGFVFGYLIMRIILTEIFAE